MGLPELKADAKILSERLAGLANSDIDLRHELTENLLPLYVGLIEALEEGLEADVADIGDALDELIDQAGDVLHADTSAKIIGVLEVGKLIAKELEGATLDDVAKKRAKQLVKAYRQGVEVLYAMISEITIPVDDDEEDDEDEVADGGPSDEPDDDLEDEANDATEEEA